MKKMFCKGVPENNYTFKCCNEGFCNSLKSCQNAQNNIPEVVKIRIFPRGACPRTPYYVMYKTLLTQPSSSIGYKCSQPILTNSIHNKQLSQCQLFGGMYFVYYYD